MKKILLLDHDKDMLHTVAKYMSLRNYAVDAYADNSKWKTLLMNDEYSLVICDIYSEPVDGLSLAKEFADARAAGNPVCQFLLVGPEEISKEQYIFIKRHGLNYMVKYKSSGKWAEMVESILNRRN